MKYVRIDNGIVAEIIPAEDPTFPGVLIDERYTPDFIVQLTPIEDDVVVEQNYVFDEETGTFSEPVPVVPEPTPDPDPPAEPDPSELEALKTRIAELEAVQDAMMEGLV